MNTIFFKRAVSAALAIVLCVSAAGLVTERVQAVGRTTVTVGKRTKSTATLKIASLKGVTGYQVFIAATAHGKYKQIGATRNNRFILTKLKKNKVYYTRVRAYRTIGTRIVTGKYSLATKIGKYVTTTVAERYAAQVLSIVNEERAKEGLDALKANTSLNTAACIRAKELVSENSPIRPDGRNGCSVLTDQGIVYETAGENIASGIKTPREVVETWMEDAGHRAQILSKDYTYMGLGYYSTTKGDKYYWSQLFMK
jgi:uncharacterized protein YkwD